ncbi:MAG: right-handed parallel beta-helix repeat-containing protein, partial [Lentisphaeria bacterium]|nr:right-handed parallel beta-helix repeat-containing protein [Lentisphaeria bacterium]
AYGKTREEYDAGSARAGGRIWTPYFNWGIYFDNSGTDITVFGNIVVRAGAVGICVQCGQNNLIENNIIVDARCAAHFGGWWQPQMAGFMTGNHFCRNIFYCPGGVPVLHRHIGFTSEPLADALGQSDYNVVFGTESNEYIVLESSSPLAEIDDARRTFPVWPEITEVSCAEWLASGFDVHSVIADPLFADPANDDYRLQPESPALKLGFQHIDTDRIGPRAGSGTTDLPGAR